MDKILKLFDSHQYEAADYLATIQLYAAKAESEKQAFRSLKAHALCQLGYFGYARQIIDTQIYAQLAAFSEVDKRTITMLNYTYAMNCEKALHFLNFEIYKIDPLDKMYAQRSVSTTVPAYQLREELVLQLARSFLKLCKHRIEGVSQICERADAFFALLVTYVEQGDNLKNENQTGVLGDRVHRQNGFSYVNTVFYYLAALLCHEASDATGIKAFMYRWIANHIIGDALMHLNPRLHMLLKAYCEDADSLNAQLFKALSAYFSRTYDKSCINLIIDFAQAQNVSSMLPMNESFDTQYIVFACKYAKEKTPQCNLLPFCKTLEDFVLAYDLYRYHNLVMELRNDVSDLVFSKCTKERILGYLESVTKDSSVLDALMISGALINGDFQTSELSHCLGQLKLLIEIIEKDFYHNAYYLKVLVAKASGNNASFLLTEYSYRTYSAHNLYLTSMPLALPAFFNEQCSRTRVTAKDVFKSLLMLNHTDDKSNWEFPQIMLGAVLFGSQHRYALCHNVDDALFNAGNPYTAGRLLETRHYYVRSYQRMFADAVVSAYNVIFASVQQLKDKGNLLFEGVCGNEATTSPAAAYFIFGNNYDVTCQASLYFAHEPFFDADETELPQVAHIETKTQPKSLLAYDLFGYNTSFSSAFTQMFIPKTNFPSKTQFGLLASFCAAVARLAFCVITNKCEALEQYVHALSALEIPFFDTQIKDIFVSKFLLQKVLGKQQVEYYGISVDTKKRNCDVYVAGPLALAIIKVADLKKVDTKAEKEIFKRMFGNILPV